MLRQVGDDRRDAKRNRMLKGGVIAFSARHATIPCVLRDMSDTGARLQVAQGASIPDTFELIVELDGLEVACEVIWRRPTEVGVRFLVAPTLVNPKRVQVVAQTGVLGRPSLRRLPTAHTAAPATNREARPAPIARAAAAKGARHAVATTVPDAAAKASAGIPILVAEDDPDDRLLMADAFQECGFEHPIEFVENGEELLSYVRGEAPYEGRRFPALILLDLNMPRMDGRTALMHLKTHSTFKRIPVIVLTTSNAEDDIQRTYDLGVTAYVTKPSSQQGLVELIQSLDGFWSRYVSLPAA